MKAKRNVSSHDRPVPRGKRGQKHNTTGKGGGRSAPKAEKEKKNWKQLCIDLQKERDELIVELAKLKTERDQYLKAVYALTWEDIDIPDKETMLAQLGQKPTLQELIAELESQGAR